jgi:hypothetical protein
MTGPTLQIIGFLVSKIIEESDGAAIAAIEKEMQKVWVSSWSPATRGNGMNERQSDRIAIKLDGFL